MSSWADVRQAEFTQILRLTDGLTFSPVRSGLADTDLVRAFHDNFEAAAFASFIVGNMTDPLRRRLRSFGDGFAGILDPYFERLLSCEAMHAMLPDLAIAEVDPQMAADDVGYRVVDPLLLEGHLAIALRNGGAYSRVAAPQALHMAADFRNQLCADRYDNIVTLAGTGWSDWFHMMTGDYAWLITDIASDRAHLLCASGND